MSSWETVGPRTQAVITYKEKKSQIQKLCKKVNQHYLQLTQGWVIRETVQVSVLGDWVGGGNCYDSRQYRKKKYRVWESWLTMVNFDFDALICWVWAIVRDRCPVKLNQTPNSHERAALDSIQNVWFETHVQCSDRCVILGGKIILSILSLLFFNIEIWGPR